MKMCEMKCSICKTKLDVCVDSRLCRKCEEEIIEEHKKKQDKIMEELHESIKRDSY